MILNMLRYFMASTSCLLRSNFSIIKNTDHINLFLTKYIWGYTKRRINKLQPLYKKTLINSEYLLGQFKRRCNNPQYQEGIKLQIILTIAKKAAPRMENSTDHPTQGGINSPLARKAFLILCIIFNFLSPIWVRFIVDINIGL